MILFDDIDSFPPSIAQFLNIYRDQILESGRHHNLTVLSTSHQLYNWAKTRVILNEAETVCMFPHSNKRNSMLFLRDRSGLGKQEIVDMSHILKNLILLEAKFVSLANSVIYEVSDEVTKEFGIPISDKVFLECKNRVNKLAKRCK